MLILKINFYKKEQYSVPTEATETLYKQLFKNSRAELPGWIFLYTDASKISNAVALPLVKDNNDMVEAEAAGIYHAVTFESQCRGALCACTDSRVALNS